VGLSDGGLADEFRRALRESRRWEARRAELLAEAERRGVACREGYASTTAWLIALSGEPAGVCRSRMAVAAALKDLPQTRRAFTSGELCESRVKLLADAQAVAPEQFARDETALVARVAAAPAGRAPRVLAEWKRHADPAAAEAEVERLHTLRALHLSTGWFGMVHLNGDLDPEAGGVVLAAIRSLAEPVGLDPADTRSPAQCRADALAEICRRYLDGGSGGSRRPHLTITVPRETLQEGRGVVDTEAGPITVESARRLACDATISPVITGPGGRPATTGPVRRVVHPALRRALEARDQHCTHLGCDMPARWCDAHHIQHWADGGKTQLSNLRLLCRRHHRVAHHHQPYPQRK
jgi:hypothetical protein